MGPVDDSRIDAKTETAVTPNIVAAATIADDSERQSATILPFRNGNKKEDMNNGQMILIFIALASLVMRLVR